MERLVILIEKEVKHALVSEAKKESKTTGLAVTLSDIARKALKQFVSSSEIQK